MNELTFSTETFNRTIVELKYRCLLQALRFYRF